MKRFLLKTIFFLESNQKFLITLLLLAIYRFGSEIPLGEIDQTSLKSNLLFSNSILQTINIYSNGGNSILTPFSLGIIPFINASIIIDLAATIFPFFEKLQSEEGEAGKRKLFLYKKLLSLIFASFQAIFLIFSLQAYFYNRDFFTFGLTALDLISGSFIVIWLSTMIDKKGIGNGTSLIILVNILITNIRQIPSNFEFQNIFTVTNFFEFLSFSILLALIINSQIARYTIPIVSARQLSLLKTKDFQFDQTKTSLERLSLFEGNGLTIKYTQAGIFPVIIASNILPFLSVISLNFLQKSKIIETFIYYCLIITFNYFYTTLFWDPEKISEQLRKASVSIVGKNPGKETSDYLRLIAFYVSLNGGIYLCSIFSIYDLLKEIIKSSLLNQVNISSLIIAIGILCETVKNLKSFSQKETQESYESTSIR